MDMIEYTDFKKLEMRVGNVIEVERIPKTDKLYKMLVDVGGEDHVVVHGAPHFGLAVDEVVIG